MKTMDGIALTLLIIGALNWGLVGIFNFNLIYAIFNDGAYWVARVIYSLVGISGLYCLSLFGRLSYNRAR